MAFKPGDRVRMRGSGDREYILDEKKDSKWWRLLDPDGKTPGGGCYEWALELIQEEPMAHPYLTPEKIEQLAAKISEGHVSEDSREAYRVAKAVLEREANPPPKIRTFKLIFPGKRIPETGHEIASIMADAGYVAIVEEVPA